MSCQSSAFHMFKDIKLITGNLLKTIQLRSKHNARSIITCRIPLSRRRFFNLFIYDNNIGIYFLHQSLKFLICCRDNAKAL